MFILSLLLYTNTKKPRTNSVSKHRIKCVSWVNTCIRWTQWELDSSQWQVGASQVLNISQPLSQSVLTLNVRHCVIVLKL